jgi:uncharacterized protein
MQDLKFLNLCGLVASSLIISNIHLFIKSFGSSELATHEIKQAAQQIKIEGLRKVESNFWDSIKEIDREPQVIAQATEAEAKFQKANQVKAQTKKKVDIANLSESTKKSVIYSVNFQNNQLEIPLQKQNISSDTFPNESFINSQVQLQEPCKRFLLVGDSIMSFLGVAFENNVKKSDYDFEKIKVFYKISTGLNRIDFYDWYARTRELIQQNNPDAMVIIFGGNDDQNILDINKKLRAELTPEWEKAYEERVERYAKLLDEYPIRKVYWIGHPMSNVARYNQFFPIFNRIYKKVAASHPKIEFVDYWHTFAKDGKFVPIAADSTGRRARVRYNDGLHPSEHGAKIMIEILRKKMIEEGILRPKAKSTIQPKK